MIRTVYVYKTVTNDVSWKSILLSAWAPPLITLIIGTGKINGRPMDKNSNKFLFECLAKALAYAKLKAKIEFAPSLDLFWVPSILISNWSNSLKLLNSFLIIFGEKIFCIFSIDCFTPLPKYFWLFLSLNSIASCLPTEAPEGTEHNVLSYESRKLYHFIEGGNPTLSQNKREAMFVQMLEGLHPNEADILVAAKDKVLHQKYKGLSANVVKEAFDWDDNYMLIEHDTYPQAPGAAHGWGAI